MGLLSKLVYKKGTLESDSDELEWPLIVDEDADPTDANLVTSLVKRPVSVFASGVPASGDRKHAVLLDLDIPVVLLPSSSWGNSHLYIEPPVLLTDEQLFKLLDVLAECGIIQRGFANASVARGYTALRPPWVDKNDE